jgi:polyhydroxyalkanoate synthesis regulator phasin
MLDDMRAYLKDRIEALSPQGAEDLAATFITMAQAASEHLSGLATGLMERSAEARAALVREAKDLIAAQIEEMGLATKKEVATLRARVERLEAKGTGARVGRERKGTEARVGRERKGTRARLDRERKGTEARVGRERKGTAPRVDRGERKGTGAGPKASSAKKPSGGSRTTRRAGKAATTGKRGAPSATRSVRSTPRRPSGAR